MKAQRKTEINSGTNLASSRRLRCPPDGTDDSNSRVLPKYSPKVLVGEWQTAAALQREYDHWLQRRDCGRCVDLRGAYCTWQPSVLLRRTVRNGGHLYDRPLAQDDDCSRLLHRGQLKSLYDQHYNEHPATHPAHVDCPYSLPEGPTNFGLLDKKAAKWQEEITGLVELRTGPSLYQESYVGRARDNETKGLHVDCKNDFKDSGLRADMPMPSTGSLSTPCKPLTALEQQQNMKVLSTSCKPSTALSKCDNTKGLLTSESHSTALDHSNVCDDHQNNALTICSVPRRNAAEHDCRSASAVRQAFDSANPNSNAENELAGNKELKYNVTEKNIQKNCSLYELPERKVSQCELHSTNVPECEFSQWNGPEFESERKEVRECAFPGRNVSESEFQRDNLRDCDCPGIQTPPFIANNGAQHRFITGIDVKKPGWAGKEFPESRLIGNDVPGWGLDPGIDLKLERRGQRFLPPTPIPFVLTANNNCHSSCLNPSVF